MGRLAQTEGLSDDQAAILEVVHEFVEEEIIPVAQDLEHADEYPAEIVEGMKTMGIFGLMIPEKYGGLGESLLTYALCVEEIARGWMSVSGIINTHFIVAYMLMQHGTEEQKEYFLPRMATGEIRGSFSMSEPHCGSDVAAITSRAVGDGDDFVLTGQKMWLTNGGSSTLTAVLVRTDAEASEGASVYKKMTTFLVEKPAGFGEGAAGSDDPGEDREDGVQGCRHDRAHHGRAAHPGGSDPGRGAGQGVLPDDGRRRGRPRERRRARGAGSHCAPSSSASTTPSSAVPSASRSPITRPCSSASPTWPSRSRPHTR